MSANQDALSGVNLITSKDYNLYNGNIASWTFNHLNDNQDLSPEEITGVQYRYDELNRLIRSEYADHTPGQGSNWASTNKFRTEYSYDANGNIMSLKRNDGTGALLDDLEYNIYNGIDNSYLGNNRLNEVRDAISGSLTEDNDYVGDFSYSYDADGNLISVIGQSGTEDSEDHQIEWTVHGKVKRVIQPNTDQGPIEITFFYDAMGNRVKKDVRALNDQTEWKSTFYVRDG